MNRRDALRMLAATLTSPLLAACSRKRGEMSQAPNTLGTNADGAMPVLFVAHGAPPLLDDDKWKAELAEWGATLPKPKAILSLSAHWEAMPVAIGSEKTLPLVYDFYGFPERYYTIQYGAPGAPALAARIRELLRERGIAFVDAPERGLDHGTYVPLMSMYPAADIPVLQVSLPGLSPKDLAALGRALAPLRDEGVLLMGSGFLTHNMRALGERTAPAWAREFDAWASDVLSTLDLDALVDFEKRAPAARIAHPRTEHFAPVIAAAAAAHEKRGPVIFPITGYWDLAPAFTKRSVQIG